VAVVGQLSIISFITLTLAPKKAAALKKKDSPETFEMKPVQFMEVGDMPSY